MKHLAVILCALSALSGASAAAEAAQKPNFIVILADDLGYGDLACYGAKDITTPHIDQMAREGAKFTSCYVAPVCSPTRASLMTGCIAQRVGIGGVLFPRNNHGLNPDEKTLPELLKAQGYATAIVGKWHLGNQDLFQPLKHGFDTWYGTPASSSQGFDPSLKQFAPDCTWRGVHTRESILKLKEAPCPLVRDNVVIEVPADQSQFTQRYTREATYGTAKCGDTTMPLLLDIYQPVATDKLPEKLPAMIFAFGGGWTKGSKDVKYIRDLCESYAARGYVAISIQYRIAKDNPPALAGPGQNPEKNEQFRLINAAFQDTCNAVRWVRTNADKYDIDPNRIGIGGVSAGAFNALHTGFCDEKLTGPDAEVAAVISLMGAVGANQIDKDDPPVFIAHGTSDNVVPYAMVKNMVQQLERVDAKYCFFPIDGVAHRLQTILDTKFDGKTVRDHSLDFCFEAMKLGELIKEAP